AVRVKSCIRPVAVFIDEAVTMTSRNASLSGAGQLAACTAGAMPTATSAIQSLTMWCKLAKRDVRVSAATAHAGDKGILAAAEEGFKVSYVQNRDASYA